MTLKKALPRLSSVEKRLLKMPEDRRMEELELLLDPLCNLTSEEARIFKSTSWGLRVYQGSELTIAEAIFTIYCAWYGALSYERVECLGEYHQAEVPQALSWEEGAEARIHLDTRDPQMDDSLEAWFSRLYALKLTVH